MENKPFAQRIVANCIVEGLFFSSAFAVIFWLKKFKSKGKHFKWFICLNNLISIDEGMHVLKGFMVYDELVNKLRFNIIYEMFDEAVGKISKFFSEDCIGCKQIGINE